MSPFQHLLPSNTLSVKVAAYNAFCRFLNDEGMAMERLAAIITQDDDARAIPVIMDKFAIYLAFHDGKGGKKLSKNTVVTYFGNVKNWLFDQFPLKRATVERQVVNMVGYLDGLLLVWMWYLFGRSSDLNGVKRSDVCMYPGGAMYVSFSRIKTSDLSGLALHPDKASMCTCPVFSLAVAVIMKASPDMIIFDHIPRSETVHTDPSTLMDAPLEELLNVVSTSAYPAPCQATPISKDVGLASPTVHGYVNRLLSGLSKRRDNEILTKNLTSHSFRRGGAQHANSNSSFSPQWIFDRGSWSMTATNKAFAYVFNTTQEDQKVSKWLSGWCVEDTVVSPNLDCFDSVVAEKIDQLKNALFRTAQVVIKYYPVK